jgi:membrane protein implicated in regulation of membrane protease activity
MGNGMALVFIGEAFLLMLFLAVLISKLGWQRPGWQFFIVMSLLGSLAFSIPLQLYLRSKSEDCDEDGESEPSGD